MRNSMEELFEQGFSRPWRVLGTAEYRMGFPVNLWETNDALELQASLPGVQPSSVDISLTGDAGTIHCKHDVHEAGSDTRYVVREINAGGSMQRTISLPAPVNPDAAQARYEHGMLYLRMPKAESARVRQIKIADQTLLN